MDGTIRAELVEAGGEQFVKVQFDGTTQFVLLSLRTVKRMLQLLEGDEEPIDLTPG